MGEAGVGHAPAPVPEPFTVTAADVEPSLTLTIALEKAEEGLARRTDKMLPFTVATTLPLVDAAVYVPEPPEMVTCALPLQSVRVTELGLTATELPPAPQAPAPAPLPVTAIPTRLLPSDTLTVALLNGPDGFARRIVTTFPLTVADTLPELLAAV